MQYRIPNMTCGGCARGVARAVQSVDRVAKVIATRRVGQSTSPLTNRKLKLSEP